MSSVCDEGSILSLLPAGSTSSLIDGDGRFLAERTGSASPQRPVVVKYEGELPAFPTRRMPVIYLFDSDKNEYRVLEESSDGESAITEDEEDEWLQQEEDDMSSRRVRRILTRCDEWIAQSSQFFGMYTEAETRESSVKTERSNHSTVLPSDSASQVAADEASSSSKPCKLQKKRFFIHFSMKFNVYFISSPNRDCSDR